MTHALSRPRTFTATFPAAPVGRQRSLAALVEAVGGGGSLPALAGDDYARAHAAFEARSSQRTLLTGWLLGRLAVRHGRELAVLSVGCGDGTVDAQVAEFLTAGNSSGQITYVGVDPHQASVTAFERRLELLDRPALTVSGVAGTLGQVPVGSGFDVVMFVHSLYYVESLESTLAQARRLLRPGGEILILHAQREGLNELAALLAPSMRGRRQWWAESTEHAVISSQLNAYTGILRGVLDLRVCRDPEDRAGRDVLDFTVQGHLPDELRDHVLEVLRNASGQDDELCVPHRVRTWILTEPRPGVSGGGSTTGRRTPPDAGPWPENRHVVRTG